MKPSKTIPGVLLAVFGLLFLAPGVFLSVLYFRGFQQWWDARSWEETPCRIESAELHSNRGSKSTTYQVTATYRYHYGGRSYQSDRVGFSTGSDNVGDFHQRAYRELAPYARPRPAADELESGDAPPRPFRCFVNPAMPEEAVLYRELRWEMQAFMAIFALTFPAVGAGVMVAGLASWRRQRRELELQAGHPGEPWRWRPEWAGPAIPESSGKWRGALYAYTLWATAVVMPLLAGTWLSGAFQRSGTPWWLLIFLALWCIPAGLSWRRFRQRAAVGAARLELSAMPVAPGTVLTGEVVLGKAVRVFGGAEATLACERRTTRRHGNKTSTSTETVWSQTDAIGPEIIVGDVASCRIPVRFTIPPDALTSGPDLTDASAELFWKLTAKVPGAATDASFDVPGFPSTGAPMPSGLGDPGTSEALERS